MIDDLKLPCLVHKFIDDTTLSEALKSRSASSNMSACCDQLQQWSTSNLLQINLSKTKEMIFGHLCKHPPSVVMLNGQPVQRVTDFKLLGVVVSNDLRWEAHVDAICAKASSKIYYLKMLKRAGLSTNDLLCFYTSVIRPTLEYVCYVWHHGLTLAQSDRLEALQKRSLRIIFGDLYFGIPYFTALQISGLDSLHTRRTDLSKTFFHQICDPANIIHHLLPQNVMQNY